jgi:uncharacterized membrane protein
MQTYHPGESINVHPAERWISTIAGTWLAWSGIQRGFPRGWLPMLAGAVMIRRGVTGHCDVYRALGINTAPARGQYNLSVPYELGVHVRVAITVAKPRPEVYGFWRNFQNLPRVMRHLLAVKKIDEQRWRWAAEAPLGHRIEWDAELITDNPNECIAWRSLSGSEVDSAGSVYFKDAPGGRGTEILIIMQYNPPAGYVGALTATLFGKDAKTEIESDLYRLKEYLETGEVARTEGQPRGPSLPELEEAHREAGRERGVPELRPESYEKHPVGELA